MDKLFWGLLIYVITRILSVIFNVDGFISDKKNSYSNLYYKSASRRDTNKASLIILLFLAVVVFGISEITFLNIWNPPTTLLDKTLGKAIEQYPVQANRWVMGIIFVFNVGLIEFIIRFESVYSTITRFNQMLAIIRPDIDCKEYYRLKKDWALMKSKTQYRNIIIELFKNHKILIDEEKFPNEVKIFNQFQKEQAEKLK